MKENISVNEWFHDEKCNFAERPVTHNSIRARESAYRNHIKPCIGDKMLNDVKKADICMILDSMKKQGYSFGMLSGVYAVLTLIFRSAERSGLIDEYPCASVHKNYFYDL